MAAPRQDPNKPTFKAPEQKPFQMAGLEAGHEPPPPPAPPPPASAAATKPAKATKPAGWQPIASAPQDESARFMVRATVQGKPISGTETVVRYRPSRKMVGRRWEKALSIIDDRLGTKLGFRPTEWRDLQESDVKSVSWDEAIAKANALREKEQNA